MTQTITPNTPWQVVSASRTTNRSLIKLTSENGFTGEQVYQVCVGPSIPGEAKDVPRPEAA